MAWIRGSNYLSSSSETRSQAPRANPSGLAGAWSWKLYFCFDNVIAIATTFLFCCHMKISKSYSDMVRSLIEVDWGSVCRNSWPMVRVTMIGYYITGKCSSYCQYMFVKHRTCVGVGGYIPVCG